jgi:hypothetical protein
MKEKDTARSKINKEKEEKQMIRHLKESFH